MHRKGKSVEKSENVEEDALTLKVAKSSIKSVGSGIARMNEKHLKEFDGDIPEMIVVKAEEHKKVLKLVSDRFADKGKIVLREDDMEDLDLDAGDEVDIMPYVTLKSEIKEKWDSFKERFKKEEEEEEEEDA